MQFRYLLLTRFIVINTFLGALVMAAFAAPMTAMTSTIARTLPTASRTRLLMRSSASSARARSPSPPKLPHREKVSSCSSAKAEIVTRSQRRATRAASRATPR